MNNKEAELLRAIGLRFGLFRRLIDKSLAELAEELEVRLQELEDFEAGINDVVLDSMNLLVKNYGLSMDWLISGQKTMFYTHCLRVSPVAFSMMELLPELLKDGHVMRVLLPLFKDPQKKEAMIAIYAKPGQQGQ